jgi:AraC family transcriptional regulator
MSQLTAVANALRFVENHLKDQIGVADMAGAAGYSLYHFSRVFNALVHHTPYDYLVRRRLSESTHWLADTDRNIVDIAFEYQFGSHETFSRAFKRMFALPPSRYREACTDGGRTAIDRSYLPPLTAEYLRHINQEGILRPDPLDQPAIDLIGLMSWVDGLPAIAGLWDTVQHELQELREGSEPCALSGLIWYPPARRGDGCYYLAGFARPRLERASSGQRRFHPGFVTKTLPALPCARFVHRGPLAHLTLTRGYIYHTWLPGARSRVRYPLEIERWAEGAFPQDDGLCACEILVPIA